MNAHSRFLLIGTAIAVATIVLTGCSKAPDTTATSPAILAASNNVADSDVTANVKSAFSRDDALKGFDIAVVTLNGDVQLIGKLDNQGSIDHAIAVARAAEGVHSIHDELTIK